VWLKNIENARRGPKYLIEKPSPLKDAMAEELAKRQNTPIWLGREMGGDSHNNPVDDALCLYERDITTGDLAL
jgi:hypothetical protein